MPTTCISIVSVQPQLSTVVVHSDVNGDPKSKTRSGNNDSTDRAGRHETREKTVGSGMGEIRGRETRTREWGILKTNSREETKGTARQYRQSCVQRHETEGRN